MFLFLNIDFALTGIDSYKMLHSVAFHLVLQFFCIFFVIYVSRFSLLYYPVFSLKPCDYLLGKSWPLGSLVCDVSLYFCHFPIWCLG